MISSMGCLGGLRNMSELIGKACVLPCAQRTYTNHYMMIWNAIFTIRTVAAFFDVIQGAA